MSFYSAATVAGQSLMHKDPDKGKSPMVQQLYNMVYVSTGSSLVAVAILKNFKSVPV